jgi:hypothetical protein
MDNTIDKDAITAIAVKMTKNAVDYKQPRMNQIKVIEEMLAYKQQPALKGRINVPFDGVIMNGFIDTLCSQVNKFPRVTFEDTKGSNLLGAKKTQAFFDEDTGHNRGQWKRKDRWSKRLCAVSNIGIFEIHAESDPKYKSILNNIDHYDFIFDPTGGSNIEDHLFVGRTNIFKTKEDLKNPLYDQDQVAKLIANTESSDFKKNEDLYQNKVTRFNSYGLTIETANYVGQNLYNLTELELSIGGVRYYVLFDYKTGTWVRFDLLKNVFESNLYSYTAWNGVENPFNILGPGLADMIAVVAESIRVNLNEILNNNRKRNWDMKAVDSQMFPDVSALDWRQDGVVHATLQMGQSIQNGIYRFETPEITGALNLNNYLNSFVGMNSGITDQTKGESSQSTLGIANLDNMNLSKKMQLIGDSYSECMAALVYRWDWNQYEHLEDEYAVKVLGKNGLELTNFGKKDSEPEYDIKVVVDDEDVAQRKIDLEKKSATVDKIFANPALLNEVKNKKMLVSQMLEIGGWTDDQVRMLMNSDGADADSVSRANKGIEDILLGQEPEDIPDATPTTLDIIHSYIVRNKLKLKPEVKEALETFFDKTAEYAAMNAARQSGVEQVEGALEQPEQPEQPIQLVTPIQ